MRFNPYKYYPFFNNNFKFSFFMKKITAAIQQLQKLSKSRYKKVKTLANELLLLCANKKRITKILKSKIDCLLAQYEQTKAAAAINNIKRKIRAAAKTAAFINDLEISNRPQPPTADEAREILRKSVCIMTYQLQKNSGTTGEKAGEITSRLASTLSNFWYENTKSYTFRKQGVIVYKDSNLNTRCCSEKSFIWIYALPKNIVEIFKMANYAQQVEYCKIFTNAATKQREKQTIFHNGKLKVIA